MSGKKGFMCHYLFSLNISTFGVFVYSQDQINLLHYDSVSTKGLTDLKIYKAPSMETIVKNYL